VCVCALILSMVVYVLLFTNLRYSVDMGDNYVVTVDEPHRVWTVYFIFCGRSLDPVLVIGLCYSYLVLSFTVLGFRFC
jgi:hypothetical protein